MRISLFSISASLLTLSLACVTSANAQITYSYTTATGAVSGTVIDNFSNIQPTNTTSYWFAGNGLNTCAAVSGNTGTCNSSIGAPPQISGVGDAAVPTGATSFLQVSPGSDANPGNVGFYDIGGLSSLNNVSFEWGSVDQWNFVQLLDASGNLLATVDGTALGATFDNGDPYSPGDEEFTFNWTSSDPVATLQFGDTFGPAFEVANVTSVTPEPSSIALLTTGLLGLGNLVRRRKSA